MVSFKTLTGAGKHETVTRPGRFLAVETQHVATLLEEGRLGGVILSRLGRKGVELSPKVKNSVQRFVRGIEAKSERTASNDVAVQASTPGGTATIMFTDIVGSTELVERLGDRNARIVLAQHERIVRRQTAAFGGTEVKSMGDGFMLAFQSASSGVACAVGLQQEIANFNSLSSSEPLSVRIGLSVGEPIRDSNDLFGMSVITASRIAGAAAGGQILVSEIVVALASSSGDFVFEPFEKLDLKGISGTQQVHKVVWKHART